MSSGDSSWQVLFIGGLGRSGSTIFELSLGTDSRVVSLGEVIHLWERCLVDNELCGCGVPFYDCLFWRNVGDLAFGGWHRVDPERVLGLRRRIDRTVRVPQLIARRASGAWRRDVEEYASYYYKIYSAAATITERRVVVDSSKQASTPYVLRHATRFDLSVVHCVRDPRAVAYSWSKRVLRPEAASGKRAHMAQYSPSVTAMKWMQHNLVIEGLPAVGIPVHRVRYEDWVRAPAATMEDVLEFSGLRRVENPNVARGWIDLPENHTCSGNPMRFSQGRTTIRHDEKWRTGLGRSNRRIVTSISLPGLLRYGYLM